MSDTRLRRARAPWWTAVALGPLIAAPAIAQERAVSWTETWGTNAAGSTLTKTGPEGWNSRGISTDSLASGDGYFEFTAGGVADVVCGLSTHAGQGYERIDFALQLGSDGSVRVLEDGAVKSSPASYVTGDRFRIAVESGTVRYYKLSSLLYSSSTALRYPLSVGAYMSTLGASIEDAVLSGVLVENVRWTAGVNVTVSGNDVQKTTGADATPDAGAISTRGIGSGDGYVEFTADIAGPSRTVGLATGDTDQTPGDIDFSLSLGGGTIYVTEAGVSRGSFGSYSGGDRLRVAVEDGVVTYRRNGALLYTSTVSPAFPLLVDTSFSALYSSVNGAVLSGELVDVAVEAPVFSVPTGHYSTAQSVTVTGDPEATIHITLNGASPAESDPSISSGGSVLVSQDTVLKARAWKEGLIPSGVSAATYTFGATATESVEWTAAVNVAASEAALTKSAGTNGVWDAGAVSTRAIVSMDGYVELVVDGSGGDRLVGLSHGDTDQGFADVDYALYLSGSLVTVYEGGVSRGGVGSTAAGDHLRVAIEGGVIRYRKNGALLYTSPQPPVLPLLVDTSLATLNSSLPRPVISGLLADTRPAAPTVSPNGGLFFGSTTVSLSTTTPGTTIRYTLDGSEPSPSHGTDFVQAFSVSSTTTVKAAAFLLGVPSSTTAVTFYEYADLPSTVSGLKVWLRADRGVETANGFVTVWHDQSGTGDDASQTTSANRPALVTDAASGLPVLRFDGTNDNLVLGTQITTGQTALMVVRNSSAGGSYRAPLGNATGYVYTAGTGRQIWTSSFDPAAVTNGETWLNGAAVDGLTATYPAASGPLAVVTSVATAAVTTSRVGMTNASAQYWQGDVAEVLIYDHALSGVERHQLEEYLMRKYSSVSNLAPSPPSASPNGGLFTDSVSVTLSTTTPGATIRYTVDGGEPTPELGTLYSGPLTLTTNTIVKAKAYLGALTSTTAAFDFYESSAFNPTKVSGLKLWLRATSVEPVGGFVDRWRDQSGNGNDATQSSSARLPALVTDTASGLPVLRFDGTNDNLVLGTQITTGQSVLMVLRNSNAGGSYRAPLGNATGYVYTAGTGRQIWTSSFDPAAVTNGETWLNGAPVDGLTATYPAAIDPLAVVTSIATAAVTTSKVGMTNASAQYWQGDVAEVLIYDHALSGVERHQLEEYLMRKYSSVSNLAPSPPSASPNGGLFTDSVSVALSTTTPGATIRYTVDGSEPTPELGTLYSGPVTLTTNTIVKAKAYLGALASTTAAFDFYESSQFNPTKVSGLKLWLRATSVEPVAGLVERWCDQSSNGNDAVQSSFARRPALATDAASGLPVLRFDGTNDNLALGTQITTGQTVFMVLRNSSTTGYRAPLGTDPGNTHTSGTSRQLWTSPLDPAAVTNGETWLNGGPVDGLTAAYPAADGPLAVVTSIATGALTLSKVGMTGASYYYWQGDIAEVLIYDHAPSWTERRRVEEYLGAKYHVDYWFARLDSDGDGLPDQVEAQIGSDPHNPDSNGDGIQDGPAYAAGLSVTSMDMDGDGLTNAAERALGTDPFLADTDGDGVPDGADCFPLDPSRSACPSPVPGDTTPPTIELTEPPTAVLISSIP